MVFVPTINRDSVLNTVIWKEKKKKILKKSKKEKIYKKKNKKTPKKKKKKNLYWVMELPLSSLSVTSSHKIALL